MNLRKTNLFLALVVAALVLAWLFSSYRLVPKDSVSTHPQQEAQDRKAGAQASAMGVWRVAIQLNMPGLDIPAVQCGVFSRDPLKLLDQARQRAPAGDPAAMWDLLFCKIQGDEVYLLSSSTNSTAGLASDAPAGKKWLVTKVARSGENAYIWNVPFEALPGKDASLELSKSNAVNVTELFKN